MSTTTTNESTTEERMEWVEIIEPKTQEIMYANLRTGECVWDPPLGVPVKKTHDNQWWELFDHNTNRFYYYNATSQKTVWHRPTSCDIIPLAKLQTLKQHAEAVISDDEPIKKSASKESVSTQTPSSNKSISSQIQTALVSSTKSLSFQPTNHEGRNGRSNGTSKPSPNSNKQVSTCETQTSPISPRKSHHHHHHHHHRNQQQAPSRRSNQTPWHTKTAHSQDSGRSSDSNCSVNRASSMIEAQSSSSTGLSLSASTPVIKKKPLSDVNNIAPCPAPRSIQRSSSNASSQQIPVKQKSFDINISIGGGYSLGHENRCGSISRTRQPSSTKPSNIQISRSQSFAQQQLSSPSNTNSPSSGVGGSHSMEGEEEDSMHEKYFLGGKKSVESTPQTRRKQQKQQQQQQYKAITPEYVNFNTPPPPYHSRSSSNSSTLAPQTANIPPVYPYQKSPSIASSRLSSRLKESGLSSSDDVDDDEDDRSSSLSVSSSPPTAATPPRRLNNVKPLPRQSKSQDNNLELSIPPRPSSDPKNHLPSSNSRSSSSHDCKPSPTPLYTNMGPDYQESQSHLLPLHQYILEQAKLSGCYRFGDNLAEEGIETELSEDDEQLRVEYDSDEFADDEGMSNAEDDSSSQEYLPDEPEDYLHEEYARRFNPPTSKKFPPADGRMSDYTVDGFDSRMAASSTNSSHYYNTTASLLRNTSLASNHIPTGPLGLPLETQHTSLKRKKEPIPIQPSLYSPIMERSELPYVIPNMYRHNSIHRTDMSRAAAQLEQLSRVVMNRDRKLPSESDIEKYAQDNLNIHKKGIFRKKFSVKDMLSWCPDPIRKPMTVLQDKNLKKEACDLFKLVQIYMGDRKTKVGMSVNSVALDICTIGYTKPALRDELYIQICRQTTDNQRRESLRRGWELMAICLAFFPPSPKLQAYLDSYMNRHRDPTFDFPEVGKWPIHIQVSHYATVACKRLERGGVNGKRPPRKPSVDEIEQARLQIFRPSMFGSTLQEVMALQRERFPHHKLPWIQTTLSEQVLRLQGTQTEGIFRVSADMDEVTCLKLHSDKWEVPSELLDAHTPASLLKLWYRELYEPLIPDSLYNECVTHCDSPHRAISLVERLPELNRLVLSYLIHFLQMFSQPEVVQMTKMDANNLAMVMAPNCLRCTSSDPRVIFDNARKEMAFMRTLIQHLDTNFIEGVF